MTIIIFYKEYLLFMQTSIYEGERGEKEILIFP